MGGTTPLSSHGAEVDSEVVEGTSFYHKYQAFLVRFQTTFSHKLGTCLYIVSSRTEANFVTNSTKSSGIFFELFLTVSLSRRGSSKD